MIMKVVKLLYNGFIWGLLAAVIAFQSEWLEMRMNIGYIIPLTVIVVFAVCFSIGAVRKDHSFLDKLNIRFSAINLAISVVVAFTILGPVRMTVVPAAIVREGIKASGVSFTIINTFITAILFFGALVIAFRGKHEDKAIDIERDSK